MNSKWFLLAGLILASIVISGCISPPSGAVVAATQTAEKVNVSFVVEANGTTLIDKEVSVLEGTNALDAMKLVTLVDVKQSTYGPFVEGINGVRAQANQYWALYINGEYANKGIADYYVEDGMQIKWVLESI